MASAHRDYGEDASGHVHVRQIRLIRLSHRPVVHLRPTPRSHRRGGCLQQL
mgnify:FL=1